MVAALLGDDGSESAAIVRELRVPRTLIGLTVGVGLGLAGALMQALTRNPLGDPGILGVQAGATAAIVTAVAILALSDPGIYVWSRSPARPSPRSSSTRSAPMVVRPRRPCDWRSRGRRSPLRSPPSPTA